MTFGRSGLQVHDLNELETMGVLDAAIESASMRRQTALATISQDESGTVYGGAIASFGGIGYIPGLGIVAGYISPCNIEGYCY